MQKKKILPIVALRIKKKMDITQEFLNGSLMKTEPQRKSITTNPAI